VTCREPLRISLQNNLLKSLKAACFNSLLENEIKKDQANGNQNGKNLEQDQQERVNLYIQEREEELIEIASTASKENLDLGCKRIKSAVIEKALRKVREDPIMSEAIDKRERFSKSGAGNFIDEDIAKSMIELPMPL
jgi:hypothetical protein